MFKICPDCKKLLGEEAFQGDRTRGDRLSLYCRSCKSERTKSYYARHRTEVLARINAANRMKRAAKQGISS